MGTTNWASPLIFVIQQSNSSEHSTPASGGESRTSTSSRTVGLRGWVATAMSAPGTLQILVQTLSMSALRGEAEIPDSRVRIRPKAQHL